MDQHLPCHCSLTCLNWGRIVFRDNVERHRFELTEGEHTAIADYRDHGGVLHLPHVEAPVPMRGTGAASRLMQAITEHARENSLRLRAICPYAVAWFKRHPEAADVLLKP